MSWEPHRDNIYDLILWLFCLLTIFHIPITMHTILKAQNSADKPITRDTSSESIGPGTDLRSNILSAELNPRTRKSTCPMNQTYEKSLFLRRSNKMQITVTTITAPNPLISIGIVSASMGMFRVSN
jgi:hypothetical protein